MVQLRFLSGGRRGSAQTIRRFPCCIGRAASADLRLDEAGVWDKHLLLEVDTAEGFVMTVLEGALASVNGQPLDRTRLRNGDLIEAGAATIQFWLGETRQRGLKTRETLTWAALALLCLLQVLLVYQLLK